MPNVQLSFQDSADIASWILSIPGEWPEPVTIPAVDSAEVKEGLDELVKLYVTKGGITLGGKQVAVPLSEVDSFVKTKLSQDEKLMYIGERTISRLGCFGCHNIAGFENAKPIGTPLNGWGFKSPTKLDYGHIAEYLQDQPVDDERDAGRHRPLLPGEARRAHPLGLPLPEAPPAAELRLQEDRRGPEGLGRAAPDAAVQLGERPGGDRGGHDLRARPDRREDPRQVPARSRTPRRAGRPWRRGPSS